MHILNNGNGITPKFTWLMNHPNWSTIIGCIVIGLAIYMGCEFSNSKPSNLAWFLGAVSSICIISYFVILYNMNDMPSLINDKICFTSSNKTLNRVYRASPDIEITSDETAQKQQTGTKPVKQ